MSLFPLARRSVAAGFFLAVCAAPVAADSARLPRQFALSLGFSTLDEAPLDREFWRASLRDASWLSSLPARKREATVVVPVFENGTALFQTQTPLFAGRDGQAASDEAALHAFVREAHRKRVKVLLGVEALGWQKLAPQGWRGESSSTPLFDGAPELEEVGPSLASPEVGTRFASPWNGRVRAGLVSLAREVAVRLPEADGLALDVHLSRGEPSGFGSSARIAARRTLGFDPVALGIQGTADERLSPDALRWVAWKSQTLRQFTGDLVTAFQSGARSEREVLLAGVADYGRVVGFDALRSGQDWAAWKTLPGATGVWLEGRWSEGDSERSRAILRAQPNIWPVAVPEISRRAPALEWSLLSATPAPLPFALVASNITTIRGALDFLNGKAAPLETRPLLVNAPAPEWELAASDGTLWKSRSLRGQKAVLLLVEGSSRQAKREWNSDVAGLTNAAPDLKLAGVVPVAVGEDADRSSEVVAARDAQKVLAPINGGNTALVFVDRAGFVRASQSVKASEVGARTKAWGDLTPRFEVGKKAPDFSMMDMNGQTRTLSDLRGKKALLLSFFPKCFTGGCANHMASLSSQTDEFQKMGVEVLGVSIDAADVQRDFAARWHLRFPLVPDTGRQLCLLFNATSDVDALANRQSVFIDREGIVRMVDRDVHVATHGLDMVKAISDVLAKDASKN